MYEKDEQETTFNGFYLKENVFIYFIFNLGYVVNKYEINIIIEK